MTSRPLGHAQKSFNAQNRADEPRILKDKNGGGSFNISQDMNQIKTMQFLRDTLYKFWILSFWLKVIVPNSKGYFFNECHKA